MTLIEGDSSFGALLKARRTRVHLTQQQVAEALGERGPRGVYRLLGKADWDEETVRDGPALRLPVSLPEPVRSLPGAHHTRCVAVPCLKPALGQLACSACLTYLPPFSHRERTCDVSLLGTV